VGIALYIVNSTGQNRQLHQLPAATFCRSARIFHRPCKTVPARFIRIIAAIAQVNEKTACRLAFAELQAAVLTFDSRTVT